MGRIFLHPISGSAAGRLDRPPLASQFVHSFETIRTMWLDKNGSLYMQRTGTPAAEVTPSTSIYKRNR